ncbi:hypothetical protein BZG36_05025 [Bifiguratus adelaidae]|uniref:Endoplasmic reticulum junction formation protein lunapark n=1 Tax=Bifiguratus adelaidae TaxID=1938954 RepID=A0A261XXX9_9FUNG|nr:hypothetical protein BZG36_05025 [Bifiguratus adelaidae]
MGAIVSYLRKSNDSASYEKILSSLATNISKAEVRLSEIRIRERRAVVMWLLLSTLAYFVYVGFWHIFLRRDQSTNWEVRGLQLAIVVVAPFWQGLLFVAFCAFLICACFIETNLANLRAQQKQKLEELKNKTAYYSTKSLLDRYDPASIAANAGSSSKSNQSKGATQGNTARPESQRGRPQYMNQTAPKTAMQPIGPSNAPVVRPNVASGHMPPSTSAMHHGAIMNPPMPAQRQWYDKVVDAIIGEEGPETKYALICEQCFAHNGLVLPEERETVQYICPKCGHFNPAKAHLVPKTTHSATTTTSPRYASPSPVRKASPDAQRRSVPSFGLPDHDRLSVKALNGQEQMREDVSDDETAHREEHDMDESAHHEIIEGKAGGKSSQDAAYNLRSRRAHETAEEAD